MTRSVLPLPRVVVLLAALLLPLVATAGQAAVPAFTRVEGLLTSTGGGPVADGKYQVSFGLFAQVQGGSAVCQEGPLEVIVQGGLFQHTLGSTNPLAASALAGLTGAFLEVKVEPDPALTRSPVGSMLYALRAATADALDCSGCVTAQHLDPQLLAPYAKSASLAKVATSGTYADLAGAPDLSAYAKTGSLATVATSGAYADLEGVPTLAKVAISNKYADLDGLPVLPKLGAACGTGLVIQGLKADGSYDCVKAMDPTGLPADGLDEISNKLLTNQFITTTLPTKLPIAIPDNNPVGIETSLVVPDVGVAQTLSVSVELANSDISKLKLTLYDPANAAYVLYDKSGSGTALKTTWPAPTKTVSGDLGTWIGKNPKGTWRLLVVDTGFTNNTTDGAVTSWNVSFQTLSSGLVAANKDFTVNGLLTANGGLQLTVADAHPVQCTADRFGYLYANKKDKAVYICNGEAFAVISLVVPPGTPANPALSCKALLAAAPSSTNGKYWLKPSTGAAFEAYCDMTTGGGGWTMCYTGSETVHFKTETSSLTAYGQNGYRSNCNDIGFTEVLYVNHANSQTAWFKRDSGQTVKASATNYETNGSVLGEWSVAGGVANAGIKYQMNVCDAGWMWTGLMITGHNDACWKDCGGWCGDTTSAYFRMDGDDKSSYNGVAFNENGHQNVGTKLMSVGVR